MAELIHSKRNEPQRIICDASKQGLGAVLQNKRRKRLKTVSYAFGFLSELESKSSINEPDLLAVVSSTEQFKNDVKGESFWVV